MPNNHPHPPSLKGRAFSTYEALAAGITLNQLRSARVTKISRDLFVLADGPILLLDRCRWLLAVLPVGTVISHWTAAELLQVPTRRSDRIHVTVPAPVSVPRRPELFVHGRELLPGDVDDRSDGVPVTNGPRLFIDLSSELTRGELIAVGDSLLRMRLATPDSLAFRTELSAGNRGVVLARACLPLLDGRSQSRPESLIRIWLTDADLPLPTPQAPVRNRQGFVVAHADLGYEDLKIAIEYEGRHHADSEQFGRDIERYSRMAANGWLVLRFSKEHLKRPNLVVARIRTALQSRVTSA